MTWQANVRDALQRDPRSVPQIIEDIARRTGIHISRAPLDGWRHGKFRARPFHNIRRVLVEYFGVDAAELPGASPSVLKYGRKNEYAQTTTSHRHPDEQEAIEANIPIYAARAALGEPIFQ